MLAIAANQLERINHCGICNNSRLERGTGPARSSGRKTIPPKLRFPVMLVANSHSCKAHSEWAVVPAITSDNLAHALPDDSKTKMCYCLPDKFHLHMTEIFLMEGVYQIGCELKTKKIVDRHG